jgi:hypothetical protein
MRGPVGTGVLLGAAATAAAAAEVGNGAGRGDGAGDLEEDNKRKWGALDVVCEAASTATMAAEPVATAAGVVPKTEASASATQSAANGSSKGGAKVAKIERAATPPFQSV